MKISFLIILMLCLVGCGKNAGKKTGIIEGEKMEAVLWDIVGAEVYTDTYIKKDSLKNPSLENMQLQNKIFAIHKLTRSDFQKSYDYYMAHPDLMRSILDSIAANAERERPTMLKEYGNLRPGKP